MLALLIVSIFLQSVSCLAVGQSLPHFNFNPTDWPSVGTDTQGVGYSAAPEADASMTAKYQLPSDPSISSQPHNSVNCPVNADPSWGESGSCWWTCGTTADGSNCLRPTDASVCTGPNTIGLSYDDGPENSTLSLLDFLVANNLKATFFIVGSKLVQNPHVARRLFEAGMELGVHTWSHHPLTTQSNDVIIAELGYTIKAFQQILGITPKFFRPPFGDIDDRVRGIAKAMGLIPVLWLADTGDWMTDGNPDKVDSVVSNFEKLIKTSNFPNGTIVLEHDYFQGGVDLATKSFIPFFVSNNLILQSVGQCRGFEPDGWYVKNSYVGKKRKVKRKGNRGTRKNRN